jgi:hypothetical protein
MAFAREALGASRRPKGLPFRIAKIGHVVLNARDLGRSVHFYTQFSGFPSPTSTRPRWCRAGWSSCAATPTTARAARMRPIR